MHSYLISLLFVSSIRLFIQSRFCFFSLFLKVYTKVIPIAAKFFFSTFSDKSEYEQYEEHFIHTKHF